MDAKASIYQKIEDGTFALLTAEQIAKKLRLKYRETKALADMLHSLVKEGKLYCDSHGRYATLEQFGAKVGKISGNERGFAFFMPSDGSPDLFLPRKSLNGALHGDTVLAIPTHSSRSDDEGEVLSILERGMKEIVGTFEWKNRQCGYVFPDERKWSQTVFIPFAKSRRCNNGAKVVARITSYAQGRAPEGEIIEILGDSDDFFVEELSIIRAHNLRTEFPDAVQKEAVSVSNQPITEQEISSREDWRDTLIITVDGEDTRDIDDAISIEREGDIYYLGVHIADVSHYVKYRSKLDGEAFARGTSVYFPDRVLPMLPKELSNGICSLNEGVDRLALSCLMKINSKGAVLSKRVARTVIRSTHRMTYKQITSLHEGDKKLREEYPDLTEFVENAIRLTRILKNAREKRGCVSMDIKEAKILYSDGKISIPDYERTISHEMIEQFMVLANESVASLMTEKKYPFVYRIHEQPAPEKAQSLVDFLTEAGIKVKLNTESVTPADYQNLLTALEDTPIYSLANRVMLRSMMKARYSPDNLGHFGLASDCYCHFTSPIRRYPDLCIHRVVKNMLCKPNADKKQFEKVVEEASIQSSECEKNATEAERDVDALYIVAYMQDKLGEQFDGTISGVTSFGVFVELDNTVEGIVPIDALPDDFYEFHEEKFLLKGTKHSFRLGERVRVRVVGVDWGARRTQFLLLNE